MSVQCRVTCLDCGIEGPGVGDGGFLGGPVLQIEMECPSPFGGTIPSFGYLVEALDSIGIHPWDLERFREFLVAHPGHRMYIASDHDDPATWPEEMRQREKARGVHDTIAQLTALDHERATRVAAGEFVNGTYRIECPACHAVHQSDHPEVMKAMPPVHISSGGAALFIERWVRDSEDFSHRLTGLLDSYEPFMEGLRPFVREHQSHGLRARVIKS